MLQLAAAAALGLLPCPATRWSPATGASPATAAERTILRPVHAPASAAGSAEAELAWLRDHADDLMASLDEAGALHFRGFCTSTTKPGFRRFCEALPLQPCTDPLASIGVRSLLAKEEGVYEAVNAQALAATYIGLHNDATWALTAPFAAFVCFEAAPCGGAFLVADGRRVLAELEPALVEQFCARNVSIRVVQFDASPLLARCTGAAAPLRAPLASAIAALVGLVLSVAVPLGLVVAWAEDGHTLQVLERPKPALNAHPISGTPSWFSSLHSQAAHLQRRRAGLGGEGGRGELGGVAVTDAFYGDLEPIEEEVLERIDEVVMRNVLRVEMRPGDVVLLDSYQVLHGREPFSGAREHGVVWLTSKHFAPAEGTAGEGGGDDGSPAGALSRLVNWLAVKRRGV